MDTSPDMDTTSDEVTPPEGASASPERAALGEGPTDEVYPAPGDRLVLTGVLAVDLITEVERWRLSRRIGFESWRYCLTFAGGRHSGSPDYRAIEVLRLLYDAHVAYESERGWRKPFRDDAYHVTAATIAARLNLKKDTVRDVLRRLERRGFVRRELRQGRRPYVTPDPVRIAEITFPVETEATSNRVYPVLRRDDSAFLHLVQVRPVEVGGWAEAPPINLYTDALNATLERRVPAPVKHRDLSRRARPPVPPDQLPSTGSGPGTEGSPASPAPPATGPGDPPKPGDLPEGEGAARGAEEAQGEGSDGGSPPDGVPPDELDPLDAWSALLLGWGGGDEDEVERLEMGYPLPARPNPVDEANRAYRKLLSRHAHDPGRKLRVGVVPDEEAEAVSLQVYSMSTVKLELHLIAHYKASRAEKPMNRALLATISYFRYHFPSEPREVELLARTINRLVGKLRARCLADAVADDLGVDPSTYDERYDVECIHPDVRAAMEAAGERWTTDVAILEQKEAWAQERITELVKLVFDSPYDAAFEAEERQRVPHRSASPTRARGKTVPLFSLRHEYMKPELLDVWQRLGLRQLGRAGRAYYKRRP